MPTPYDQDTVKITPSSIYPACMELADLVEETVRFGSHVLKWITTEDQQDAVEKMAFIALLRHAVELLDTIPANLRIEEISGNNHTLRPLLDTCFAMLYLVQADTSRRARAYLYMDARRTIKILKRQDPSTDEHKVYIKAHEKDRFLPMDGALLTSVDITEHQNKITQHETMLSNAYFIETHLEYERMRLGGNKKPEWYSFYDGAKNSRDLSEKLNLLATYEMFFRRYSGKVHPSDLIRHNFTVLEGSVGFTVKPIRRSGNITEIAGFACQIGKEIFKAYVDTFLPHRSEELAQWYQNKILNPYKRLRSTLPRS
jgi:hypothetical protein